MEEIWKDIEGYEGKYQVSNLGNVRNNSRQLSQKTNRSGYKTVNLYNNGKQKTVTIHRLVATAFIDNPEGLPLVNHKDENRGNNSIGNLEWCDNSYNVVYSLAKRENLTVEEYREKQPIRNTSTRHNESRKNMKIIQLDLDGNPIREWENSRAVFAELKWSDWSISECCRGNRKIAYGYKWQYVI